MCGIAGLLNTSPTTLDEDARTLERALGHRGPDDGGVWVDAAVPVALSHRRLAIVDLSAAGHQPMHSAGGRYVISYNGEIYNHQDVRAQLEHAGQAPAWRGHSDTEVLLAAIEAWGLSRTLDAIEGQYAFALWDRQQRKLTLVRDRFGEKPLHVACCRNGLLFASEISALEKIGGWSKALAPEAVGQFLRRGYIDAPRTIYRDVFALPPGGLLDVDLEAGRQPSAAALAGRIRSYWSAARCLDDSRSDAVAGTTAQAEVVAALKRSIAMRLCADVPVGCLLSGGIDSSLVAALAQEQSSRPVSTFCVGFTDPRFDESAHARRVAAHLRTDHHELVLTPAAALEAVDQMATVYDQPFGDPSQIPTLLISRFASSKVKVALSGDGGDELFGGYLRYRVAPRNWEALRRIPAPLRRAIAATAAATPDALWHLLHRLPRGPGRDPLAASALRFTQRAVAADFRHYYGLQTEAPWGASLATGPVVTEVGTAGADGRTALDTMRLMDLDSYLPGDVLVKVDRASMSTGLELRAPFLDTAVLGAALRLPPAQLVSDGNGKVILREWLGQYLPRTLFDRPKQGFGVPIAEWLRGPLQPWAQPLLENPVLEATGLVNVKAARMLWKRHQDGIVNAEFALWNVLMLSSWLARRPSR